jgi:hypothetical protein
MQFFSGTGHLALYLSPFVIVHISEVEQMQKWFSGFDLGGIPPMKVTYF